MDAENGTVKGNAEEQQGREAEQGSVPESWPGQQQVWASLLVSSGSWSAKTEH